MKLLDFIKDVWKQNKSAYLWACIVIFLGVSFMHIIPHLRTPFYAIFIGVFGAFIFMYSFSFILFWRDYK